MYSSGIFYDVLKFKLRAENFVLPRDLKPAWNFKGFVFEHPFTVVGRKSTSKNCIADRMIDEFVSGSVLLMQANDNSRAHFGDLTAKMLKTKGCKNAIIQGWTRDISAIEDIKFKVWCKGMQPQNSKDRWIVESIQEEIVIGNIFITPEDYIFADRDGILVIRNYQLEDLLVEANELYKQEVRLELDIINGVSAKEIKGKYGQW